MLRILRGFTYVAMVVVFGAGAVITVRDGRTLEKYSRVITEQEREKKDVVRERATQQRVIAEIGEEMQAVQDSLQRAAAMGIVMKRSTEIGKILLVLDNRTLRANNLIKSAQSHREAIRRHRSRWLVLLGGAFVLLGGGLVVLRRAGL
ncbi:MAG: hypothetical protein V3V49_11860 [Candidatus Krumholzibacteria bacterium]